MLLESPIAWVDFFYCQSSSRVKNGRTKIISVMPGVQPCRPRLKMKMKMGEDRHLCDTKQLAA